MRSSNLGKRRKVGAMLQNGAGTPACRESNTCRRRWRPNWCVAKSTSTAGSRLVEALVESGAEESVAPPNAFPGETSAGGKYKAANGTRITNLGQQKVRFRNAEGHVCCMVCQIADVERPLKAAAQLAAVGNRVTRHKVVKSRTSRLDGG